MALLRFYEPPGFLNGSALRDLEKKKSLPSLVCCLMGLYVGETIATLL